MNSKMGEREFSCIKQVKKTVQIPLPATFISNEIAGIAEILESWKRQYRKELQGVVVNYRHYSLSSSSGFIAPNKPFVYYNVKATFDLFCPRLGDIVKGKINRLSKEHIGCLIEETINVTIHLSKDSPQELTPYIYLNREILFEISYFSYDRKMIRVTGRITPECIQLMKDLFPPTTFENLVDTPESSNNIDEGIGTFSESTEDGQLNHTFDDSKNDESFKTPFSSNTKSKKSSKRSKSDSESSSTNTSHLCTSDEKPKKKKKHKNKPNMDTEINLSANNQSSNSIPSDTMIQNFSNFNYTEIKEEELSFEDTAVVKKHKKKRKQDMSSLNGGTTEHHSDVSIPTSDTSAGIEKVNSSKKRKRENESLFMEISEQSTEDEKPKKKKKHKDKTIPLLEEEIKNELLDVPFEDNVNAAVLSIKKEILSPLKAVNNTLLEGKKKKNKDKKSKAKDKSQKKKSKVLASGTVLKKDKKLHKKDSKKSKLNGEPSKKHKKDKSEKKKKDSEQSKKHKKDKSEKKKKKKISKK